jgi:hypothetical protein
MEWRRRGGGDSHTTTPSERFIPDAAKAILGVWSKGIGSVRENC